MRGKTFKTLTAPTSREKRHMLTVSNMKEKYPSTKKRMSKKKKRAKRRLQLVLYASTTPASKRPLHQAQPGEVARRTALPKKKTLYQHRCMAWVVKTGAGIKEETKSKEHHHS